MKMTDEEIKILLSKKLRGIKDAGLQEVVRNIIFTQAENIDWRVTLMIMKSYMPEIEKEI